MDRRLVHYLFVFFTMLKLATVNVNGINDKRKRHFVFHTLMNSGFDIFALQEVHCNSERAELWKEEWPGESIWRPGGTDRAGVAVLFHPKIQPKLSELDGDFNGRVLAINVNVDNLEFRLVNVYVHNTNNRFECENFFEEMSNMCQPEIPQIILGDFNMGENLKLDRRGGRQLEKHTWGLDALNELKLELSAVDIWRHLYPKRKEFTWHSLWDNVQSRLDRIYVSKCLIPLVNDVEIISSSIADHDMVVMSIRPPEPPVPRGPGYWKLNNALLDDNEYKTLIKDFWITWREKKKDFQNVLIWWDLGKYHLRELTIKFATRKRKQEKLIERALSNKFNICVARIILI